MAHIRKVDGKKGVKWQAIIKHKGKQKAGTFPSKRLAQEWATKIEHELFNQQYFPERVPSEHTVGEAIDRYLTEILPQNTRPSAP